MADDKASEALSSLASSLAGIGAAMERVGARIGTLDQLVRVEIMARLDRLQDDQTKQRLDMDTIVELLGQSAPSTLLARIRHLEDEIRELKGDATPPATLP